MIYILILLGSIWAWWCEGKKTMTRFRSNKYGAVKQTYNGYSYHSKAETKYAMYLDQLLKEKKIKSWDRQIKIELFGENGTRVCNYYIDFVVEHFDGKTEYIEVKGFATALWKLKWKLFKDKYGKDNSKIITLEKV